MKNAFFVTGTDTGVGKTLISAGLLQLANRQGMTTAAIKPVAAGCASTPDGLRNDDALLLQQSMSMALAYEQINPIALAPAIAPHIAADQAGRRLGVSQLTGFCRGVLSAGADLCLVEGAGGWRVPLNNRETIADLVRELQLPVVLVVAVRLGCINHALLTVEAIQRDGLRLAGWVANLLEPELPALADNVSALAQRIAAPCLGQLPLLVDPDPQRVADHLILPH